MICFNITLNLFLSAFAKLREVSTSFVMSVGPSVRIEHLGSHCTIPFFAKFIIEYFAKNWREN